MEVDLAQIIYKGFKINYTFLVWVDESRTQVNKNFRPHQFEQILSLILISESLI